MNYTYPVTAIELGVSVFATGVLLVSCLMFFYVYIGEPVQRSKLFAGLLLFLFAAFDSAMLISGGLYGDTALGMQMHRLEQVVISYTGIALLDYIKHSLTLSPKLHRILSITRNVILPIVLFITIVAFAFPNLFVSVTTPIQTGLGSLKQSNMSRGEPGTFYFLRDGLFGVLTLLILYFFSYEMFVNKNIKKNIVFLLSFLFFAFGAIDDMQSLILGKNIIFGEIIFSRVIFASAVFSMLLIYHSIDGFLKTTYSLTINSSDLQEIKDENFSVFKQVRHLSGDLFNVKNSIKSISEELTSMVSNIAVSIDSLKHNLSTSIEYSDAFLSMETTQKHEADTNLEMLTNLAGTFVHIQASLEFQQMSIERASLQIRNSISGMEMLQMDSSKLDNLSLEFENRVLERQKETEISIAKIPSFSHLSLQIRRIVIFMKDMSEKTNLLAINSGIQASKSGEWSSNFLVVSHEVEALVSETITATERLDSLLSSINSVFRDFNETKDMISESFVLIRNAVDKTGDQIHLALNTMNSQNDINNRIIKDTEKLFQTTSAVSPVLSREEENCFLISDKIRELDIKFQDINYKSDMQTKELKKLVDDINKLKATSSDFKSILLELVETVSHLDEFANELNTRTTELGFIAANEE